MRALLMGYYGARNLGDDMMLFCLERWLRERGVEITVLTEQPDHVQKQHGLPAALNVPLLFQWAWKDVWLRGKALRLIATLRRHDALIAGGGDLIRDDRGWKQFSFSIEKLVLAKLLGKRAYLVNAGVGRPHSAFTRRWLGWTLRHCDGIVVRDKRSWELCRELGAADKAHYVPDIVSMLPQMLGESAHSGASSRYCVVALRTTANAFGRYHLSEERLRNLALALHSTAAAHGMQVVFLPFQSLKAQDDNTIHRRLASMMPAGADVVMREWTGDIAEAARVIGGAQLVVAMRLHAAILADALRRPCVTMPYDEKVSEFGRQAGLQALDADHLDRLEEICRVLEASIEGHGPAQQAERPPHRWENLRLVGLDR